MSSTVIESTSKNVLGYYEGPWTIKFTSKTLRVASNDITFGEVKDLPEGTHKMISDNKKILVPLNIGLYNFYYHCVTLLLRANKVDPDATLILDTTGVLSELNTTYYKFLFKLLDDLKIKYEIFHPIDGDALYINNFYVLDQQQISYDDIDYLYNILQKYIVNKDVAPFRKIYISRKYIEERNYPNQKPGLKFNSDNRIVNEEKLEEYLSSCGFEIIRPEDFMNFVDQLNYFYEAKTIMSLTSSGMTNAIFMQPGGTMIEIITPLVLALGNPYGEEEIDALDVIHHLYQIMSYTKRHAYIGISNFDRDPETIKKTISNNEHLSRIINDK